MSHYALAYLKVWRTRSYNELSEVIPVTVRFGCFNSDTEYTCETEEWKTEKKHNEIQPRVNHSSSTILNDKSVPCQWPCIHMCGLKAYAASKTCWKASDFGNLFTTGRDTSNTDYFSISNGLSIFHTYFREFSVSVFRVKIFMGNNRIDFRVSIEDNSQVVGMINFYRGMD